MAFNSKTYYRNKYRRERDRYLAQARERRDRLAQGDGYEGEQPMIRSDVAMARCYSHLLVSQNKIIANRRRCAGMKQLSNLRKADVAHGDDLSLTRWVKEPGRHAKSGVTAPMPADATGTRFKSRVLPPSAMTALLVSGHSNVKIGRDVRKGKLRGYWIYTLSLEERATCPTSCEHWRSCYGNAMPFAKRVDHRSADFLPRLADEIEHLLSIRGRKGVLIRLHALGDFYSVAYVSFWRLMLAKHPRLALFGYTARNNEDEIGPAVFKLRREFGERAMIRSSNGERHDMATVSIKSEADCPPNAFLCPEQTGATRCCATCAACWSTTKNVAFLDH